MRFSFEEKKEPNLASVESLSSAIKKQNTYGTMSAVINSSTTFQASKPKEPTTVIKFNPETKRPK